MTAEDEDTAADPSDLPSPPRLVVGRLFNIEMLLDQVVKSGCNNLVGSVDLDSILLRV